MAQGPAKASVVAAILGDGRRAVTSNDRCIEQIAKKTGLHRPGEVGVDAAVDYPST